MSLTQQFLITLTLPAGFLLVLLYSWRIGVVQGRLARYWYLALLTATLWASTILSFYGGATVPLPITYSWQIVGHHLLSLLPLWLLGITLRSLDTPPGRSRFFIGLGFVIWLGAVVFDPAGRLIHLPPQTMAGQAITHFDLWAGVWVSSWFLPLLAAWLLARQAYWQTPGSLFRNRTNYWLFTLVLFAVGGTLGFILQQNQPIWQELSALGQIVAAVVGAISLTHNNLPDFRLTARRLAAQLTASVVVFGLAWLALWLLARYLPHQTALNTSLDLVFASAGFALLFMVISRFARQFSQSLYLPTTQQASLLVDQADLQQQLLSPAGVGHLVLRLVQNNLGVEGGCLFMVEEATGGRVILSPLVNLSRREIVPAGFHNDSPLLKRWRLRPAAPLTQFDIDILDEFKQAPVEELETLHRWHYELFMPFHTGQQLLAILALGNKYNGSPFSNEDFVWLGQLESQTSLLLYQARTIATFHHLNNYVFAQTEVMIQNNRYLRELTNLYHQFTALITPDMRRPFTALNAELYRAQEGNQKVDLKVFNDRLAELRLMVDQLITVSGRVAKQNDFVFEPVYIGELVSQVVQNLTTMIEARRVTLESDLDPLLPPVQGDQQHLTEAIQNLIHNAIKFNKIGGQVRIECGVANHELFISVTDNGVGIPAGRLDTIWQAFGRTSGRERTPPGAGTSLFLTRFIVLAHGGRVAVSSNYGSGSTFSIYLPLLLGD